MSFGDPQYKLVRLAGPVSVTRFVNMWEEVTSLNQDHWNPLPQRIVDCGDCRG